MDFFNARYYTAPLGRFNSVDPENAGADLRDPQTWNGYAYARNNPFALVDPTGMDPEPTDPVDPGDGGSSGDGLGNAGQTPPEIGRSKVRYTEGNRSVDVGGELLTDGFALEPATLCSWNDGMQVEREKKQEILGRIIAALQSQGMTVDIT